MSEIVKQDAEMVIMKIEVLKDWLGDSLTQKAFKKSIDIAIESMKELEQYRALGTVEELKEAREKQVAKKPIRYEKTARVDCPVCGNTVAGISGSFGDYCSKCGNKMDWSEEDD